MTEDQLISLMACQILAARKLPTVDSVALAIELRRTVLAALAPEEVA